MKKIITIILFTFLLSDLSAQQDQHVKQLTQYLFTDFSQGSVLQKSGTVIKTLLNYNTLTQEMIFRQNNQQLALADVQNIDTVFLSQKKFIPVNNAFYVVATDTKVPLLIQYEADVVQPGSETGFGKT